jgi:dolichol-phosphate mannosyltransferase
MSSSEEIIHISKADRSLEVSLVIPTYNERENIGLLIKRVHGVLKETGIPFEIIVVDDDSPDRTWEAAETLCTDYPGLHVIRRVNERGLARAVVRGWLKARGEILAVMDGDLQHPPETLVLLLKAIQDDDVDIAVASRHVKGGGVSRWNIIRRGVSWSATLMATWVLPGMLRTIRDPMSGFFALRRSVIEGCRLEPEGYKILLEVLARGRYRRVEEIPYTFVERKRGGSKLGPRQYWEFVIHLLRLSWQTGELQRFLKFSIVGGSGVFVNMGMLILLSSAGLGYLSSGVFAVETAIVTNFVLNEFWTFSDFSKKQSGLIRRVMRFLKFNLFCAGGAVINLGILWALTEFGGWHYLLSNLFGIIAATLWNYGMNANITWESERAERKE